MGIFLVIASNDPIKILADYVRTTDCHCCALLDVALAERSFVGFSLMWSDCEKYEPWSASIISGLAQEWISVAKITLKNGISRRPIYATDRVRRKKSSTSSSVSFPFYLFFISQMFEH